MDTPFVSVVVPTYNRLPQLRQVLDALGRQTYPRDCYEVVVVSDGSTDGTVEALTTAPPYPLVFASQVNQGPAVARNEGVRLAKGSLIVFVDDDVVAAPELVAEHVASHAAGGPGMVVVGPMLDPEGVQLAPWVEWEQRMLHRQYEAMRRGEYEATPRQFYTGNASVERERLLAVGGFDGRFRRAEDIELAYRLEDAGCRFEFNERASAYHHADRSFASWLRNARDYGVNDVIFARDHGRASVNRIVHDSFTRRSPAVRGFTLACLRHPWAHRAARRGFEGMFRAAQALSSARLTQLTLSGVYNLEYYQGVSDELGGPAMFDASMRRPLGIVA